MTKETYLHSVDILLDAYNTGTLEHGTCFACAVSNLLGGDAIWGYDFLTTDGFRKQNNTHYIVAFGEAIRSRQKVNVTHWSHEDFREYLDKLYSTKGYKRSELVAIENAFEMAIWGKGLPIDEAETMREKYMGPTYKKEGQYIGLCAVLKTMEKLVEEPINSKASMIRLQTIAHDKYKVAI